MIEKEITIEVVTPMFMGGSIPNSAEFRPQSFKGLLRYWWRASHPKFNTKELYEEEKKIFGGTTFDPGLKSKIKILKVKDQSKSSKENLPQIMVRNFKKQDNAEHQPISILNYLAYGAVNWHKDKKENIVDKEYFIENSEFVLKLIIDNSEIEKEIDLTLKVIDAFACAGSKSRNGFGSIKIKQNKNYLTNLESQETIFKELKKNNNQNYQYPAFSNNSSLWRTKECISWKEALCIIGEEYITSRLCLSNREKEFIAKPMPGKTDRLAKSYFLKVQKEGTKYWGQILHLKDEDTTTNIKFNRLLSENMMEVL